MEPTTSTNLESRRSRTGGALLAGFAVAAAAVAGYALLALSPASPTTVTRAVGYLTASVAGAVCLGGLVLVLITARPDDRGVIDAAAFRAHLAVERLSPVWLAAALVMVVIQAASDAGVSATRVLGSGMFPSALGASESARGWVAVAVCALVLTVTSRLVLRWEWHVPLLIPAIVGIVAAPVTGDAGQGPNHDYATGAVIVFALAVAVWAGVAIVAAAVGVEPELRHRVTITTLTAGSVAVGYGAGLIALRVGAGDLFRTGYGRLALLALAAVLAAVVADIVAVRT
ncbi:MAG: cytochrome c oxidase assembly protein, partial [Mycobacterium sp.]